MINPVGFKLNEQDTLALNRLVKFEADIYNGLFHQLIPDTLPVIVNIYKSRSDFDKIWNGSKDIMSPGGFYLPQTQQCYVYKSNDYMTVILHEISHRFMHFHSYQSVPKWINEGLSEFFEGLYLNEKNNIYVDEQSGRLKRVQAYIRSKQFDLKQFLSRETNIMWNKKDGVTLRYDLAYSMVYYIVKNRPNYFETVLAALRDGKDSYSALAAAYGSYEKFEKGFKEYYQ